MDDSVGGGQPVWSSVPPRNCPPPSSPGLSHSHTSKTKLLNVCVQDPREGGEERRPEGRHAGAGRRLLFLPLVPGAGSQCSEQLCFRRPPLPPSTLVLSMKGDLKARLGGCGWFGEREEVKPTAQIRDPRLVEACRRAAFPFFAAFRLQ